VKVSPFFIAASEVTEEEYSRFLLAVPEWGVKNRQTLIAEGLADRGYLLSWKDSPEPPRPSYPVREVSYHAAKAYCAYLGRLHPAYTFDLPTETEWEWAASLDAEGQKTGVAFRELKPSRYGPSGLLGLRFMAGNVWEWCRNWYAPAAYIFGDGNDFDAAERVVRGGASINPEDSVTLSTRGSQPPSWCTPYLGFRVAAYLKE
jgi:formylglycine-generating enzyme required for sulfatase activity